MRVVVADDSVLLREGLVLLLTEVGSDVVASADDAPSLIAAVDEAPARRRRDRHQDAADHDRRRAPRRLAALRREEGRVRETLGRRIFAMS